MKTKRNIGIILCSFLLVMTSGFMIFTYAKADFQTSKNTSLYEDIRAYAKEHDVEPIDAKIDRVWKAIPGYKGRKVDVEASYQKMKKAKKFDPSMIIFTEVPPAIHLDDLEAQPIYRGNPEKKMVSFIINVAWGDEFIPSILETLEENHVKATFSFDGSWVKKNPDLAEMIYDAGHEIGNHAYSHPDLQEKSKEETKEELQKTNEVIYERLGIVPEWFGPPSGSFNQQTVNVAHELNMKTILWTVDTVDWKKPAPSEMVKRVVSQVENGSMILMHPTDPVEKGLAAMIKEIKAKDLHIGPVGELMSEERIDK